MKRRSKTLIALALCAALCLGLLPGTALGADEPGYTYDAASGKLTVTTNAGTTAWRSDTSIATEEADRLAAIQSVEFGEDVTAIGGDAFRGCVNLTSVTLPAGLTAIGDHAFSECGLTSIDLSGCTGLTSIGRNAFSRCAKLETADLSKLASLETLGVYMFSGCASLTAADLSGCTKLTSTSEGMFYQCGSLTNADLSGCTALTVIGDSTFFVCPSLSSVQLPGGLTTIGRSAFSGTGLTSIDLSVYPNLTAIGFSAFSSCEDLTSVKLPADLTVLTSNIFESCNNLSSVELPAGLTAIQYQAFRRCVKLASIQLPDSLTTIGQEAFSKCGSLDTVVFQGGNAPTLGDDVFSGTAPGLLLFVPEGAAGYDGTGWPAVLEGPAAALTGLTASGGALEPAFRPGAEMYTLSLPYSAETVAFTPVAHGSGAVTVDGSPVTSGEQSRSIPLGLGETKSIPIVVKNGETASRTYTVAVTRAALTVIDQPAIQGVTPPVRGAAPVAAVTETAQYTGTVAWTPVPGGAFAAGTQYTATITLAPKPGYTLQGVAADFFTVAGALSVTHGADSGTVTAVFPATGPAPSGGGSGGSSDDASDRYYGLTPKAGAGGAIDPAERVSVREGRDRTFTITPAAGYAVSDVLVDGKSVGAVRSYTFKNVRDRHTIEAVFAPVPAPGIGPGPETPPAPAWDNPFSDVAEGAWYCGDVAWAHQRGLMTGTGPDTFDPDGGTTRAQLAVILWRLEGSPAPAGEAPFADVPGGTWYSGAVAWCAEQGLAGGYGGGLFGPGDPISREQLAALLYRYAQYKGWDVSAGGDADILGDADAADVSAWAIPAVRWACGAGIMGGATDGRLAPQEEATRAQVAAMLRRLLEGDAAGTFAAVFSCG